MRNQEQGITDLEKEKSQVKELLADASKNPNHMEWRLNLAIFRDLYYVNLKFNIPSLTRKLASNQEIIEHMLDTLLNEVVNDRNDLLKLKENIKTYTLEKKVPNIKVEKTQVIVLAIADILKVTKPPSDTEQDSQIQWVNNILSLADTIGILRIPHNKESSPQEIAATIIDKIKHTSTSPVNFNQTLNNAISRYNETHSTAVKTPVYSL